MSRTLTLLDLVDAVDANSRSESETIATIAYLVNSGHVRLGGKFRGARIALDATKRVAA
jgi:hypothetical protein